MTDPLNYSPVAWFAKFLTSPGLSLRLLLAPAVICSCFAALQQAQADHPVPFTVQWLAVDANEGCVIADFDGDGKLDVAAGRNWYRNGDWLPRPIRNIDDVGGYVHSNGDFAYDVNGDGLIDIVAGGFFQTEVHWYENPGPEKLLQGFQWNKHLLVDTGLSQNEASFLVDITGNGKPEWLSNSWNRGNPLVIWSLSEVEQAIEVRQGNQVTQQTIKVPTLQRTLVHEGGERGQGHGFGFGDVNNNGRMDIITGTGWHACPEGDPLTEPWKYHPDWDRALSAPVLVRDINGDGLNDIIWGNPHDYGLMVWFGEGPGSDGKLKFREEIVDRSFSQLHCIHFADLNGDGREELITGKRVRAHNGRDPGADEPPLICYFTIDEQGKFTRYPIETGSVGIGLQIRTADISGNGALDIVVAGKEGTQILFNQLPQAKSP